MNNDLEICDTASKLIENHRLIDEWLESIVWVASTPDKKRLATQNATAWKTSEGGETNQFRWTKLLRSNSWYVLIRQKAPIPDKGIARIYVVSRFSRDRVYTKNIDPCFQE